LYFFRIFATTLVNKDVHDARLQIQVQRIQKKRGGQSIDFSETAQNW